LCAHAGRRRKERCIEKRKGTRVRGRPSRTGETICSRCAGRAIRGGGFS
jgi:hypothetical protein